MRLRSFKLQRREGRVRLVPEQGLDGCPFGGPGVDRLDEPGQRLLAAAEPLFRAVEALEPGVRVRSLAADLSSWRMVITLEGASKPRVVRIEEPSLVERLLGASDGLLATLEQAAEDGLRARVATGD